MKKLLLVCFACFFYLFSFAQKENLKDSVSFNIPVYLVDGVEVLSLDSISKDDIESVDKDPKILKYFYPRMGDLMLIKTKSQKQLRSIIQKYKEELKKNKKHPTKKGEIRIR